MIPVCWYLGCAYTYAWSVDSKDHNNMRILQATISGLPLVPGPQNQNVGSFMSVVVFGAPSQQFDGCL